ncbi:MAG: sigma-54-dependent transcriptional regulator [Planctomycetota bacterium]
MRRKARKGRRILVIEDDPDVLEQISGTLEDEGYETIQAISAEQGMARIRRDPADLVVTDLKLPGASGLDVVERSREALPNSPVLVITAHATIDTAVEAMRRGAFHYLQKPLDIDTMMMEVEKALEHGQALAERQALRERLSAEQGLGRILGESPGIAELREIVKRVARADSTVLITGETGTGKELVANALHFESNRATGPLVKLNCAALSDTLLESELFGHEKGAFTGAERARTGRFERADGGTLFLDEISEMGEHVQAKLLRVLQGSEFERVGGDQPLRPDVRLLSATNREPEKAVEMGKLRKDLFYRLDIVRIAVPPLRERRGDIPLLACSFLAIFTSKYGKTVREIEPDAMEALLRHDWPGNVRELENYIERAVVLAGGEALALGDFPGPVTGIEAGPASSCGSYGTLNLREVERQTILKALEESGWNKALTSEKLGVFPSSLYKKMKRFGVPLKKP